MKNFIQNPILPGFYPDPSICRAGSDFYLVNSTFAYFPGIPVFHSADLAHRRQIGNAIHRPGQLRFDGHQISQGLFAPTIRHHKGVFYILCTLINSGGNFMITARDPAGPWSDPLWLEGAGGIDPSVFFDDDGRAWYTGTCELPDKAFSGDNEIYIQELDVSSGALLGEKTGIWRGALRGAIWAEGPHIYKINGWYYLLYAEGGTSRDHAVCVARSKNIKGPWEGKPGNPVLTHRYLGKNAEIVNVGHADMVDDPDGNWWMVLLASRTFEGVCPLGRETFIVPVFWEGGWPCVATRSGLVEREIALPGAGGPRAVRFLKGEAPAWGDESACDHFNGSLPLHWLVLRMPEKEEDAAFSLAARPGALRLFARAETVRGRGHPAFAGRRLRHKDWAFSAAVSFAPKAGNEAAGIILLQSESWHIRFEIFSPDQGGCGLRVVRAAGGEDEVVVAEPAEAPAVLAARCEGMALSFFYGADQYSLKHFFSPVDMSILSTEYAGGFVGTLAGVFATGGGQDGGNYADVLWAEYKGLE